MLCHRNLMLNASGEHSRAVIGSRRSGRINLAALTEWAVKKRDILSASNFGQRIAEEEGEALRLYFVETDQWKRIFSGAIDVVYGAKGSGKSAIYSLLLGHARSLQERGINVIAAENPRGTPVFKDLVEDPPTSEDEFRGLWKLYFVCLIAGYLRQSGMAPQVIQKLEEAGLLPREWTLRSLLRSTLDYVRSVLKAESVEGGIKIDPATQMPVGISGKITLREPGASARRSGLLSADDLLIQLDDALGNVRQKVWLLLDRLDVAFAETTELEANALRAVFRVYLDMVALSNIAVKIFLRTDIWNRITVGGFREASHITRHITLSWNDASLLNLVIRRVLYNEPIRSFYNVTPGDVLADNAKQSALFYRIFPKQVDAGSRKPTTLDWMLSRTADGTQATAPRELIHLLSCTRDVQLKKLELGQPEPQGDNLFERTALKEALPEVSQVRYAQTLRAEFPEFTQLLEKLRGAKTQQTADTLAGIWRMDRPEALTLADKLTDVGFFEKRRGSGTEPVFWVPFLYRDALDMVQGPAD